MAKQAMKAVATTAMKATAKQAMKSVVKPAMKAVATQAMKAVTKPAIDVKKKPAMKAMPKPATRAMTAKNATMVMSSTNPTKSMKLKKAAITAMDAKKVDKPVYALVQTDDASFPPGAESNSNNEDTLQGDATQGDQGSNEDGPGTYDHMNGQMVDDGSHGSSPSGEESDSMVMGPYNLMSGSLYT